MQRFQLLLLTAGRRLWRGMRPADFDGSWQRSVGPQMVAFTAGAQLAAATAATQYVPAVLAETDQPDEPLAAVRPQAFAGVASDGRDLGSLLEGSVRVSKMYVARGWDGGDALAQGQRWLEQALQTIATDAARDAVAAEIMVREKARWVRIVNPPCCSRCAVLAGRTYSWNADFARHPQCDCFALPVIVANPEAFQADPRELYKRGLITDLTKAQRQRLDEGASMSKVLNESRDRWRARLTEQRNSDEEAAKRASWGTPTDLPPAGTSIHDLFDRLTSRVDALAALRAAGIAE